MGGPELAGHACNAGMVDECHLFVTPIVVGGGKQSLPDGVRLELELLDERRFSGGVVHLHPRTTCHPFLSGRASRVEALRALIEHALEAGDVEFASAATVAERTLADPDLPERELEPVVVDPEVYPDY